MTAITTKKTDIDTNALLLPKKFMGIPSQVPFHLLPHLPREMYLHCVSFMIIYLMPGRASDNESYRIRSMNIWTKERTKDPMGAEGSKATPRTAMKNGTPQKEAGRDNERTLCIVSESYGHEDLKQTHQYLELPIDDLNEVQQKRSEYLAKIRNRMREGLPPEKDFSVRISR